AEVSSVKGKTVIIIKGNSFGIKKSAAPVIWDNFDSGNPSGNWSEISDSISIYSGSGQPENSQYCLRFDKSTGSAFNIKKTIPFNKLYAFVKRRYDYDLKPENHKFFRIWRSDWGNSILWAYNWGNAYQMRNSRCSPQIDPERRDPNYVIKLGAENFPAVGQWQTEEFFVQIESGIGQYDGVMGYRLNNNQHRSWATNRAMFCTGHNKPLTCVFVDNYSDHLNHDPKPGDFIWVDDVYIDNSWARVLIGNYPDYDACTNIEIQIPFRWSEKAITITVNRGSLRPWRTHYIYVFDANGNVNAEGFPVYLVASSGEKPRPPKGLKIVK
ncbi:MAG: hypothetical protein JRC86_09110, partial [Deltaproteobacteria bacterium]|nr:hypothetical protein [Deltaproteobacteria bacterium]